MKTNARGSGMKTFLAVIFSVMLTFTMMPVLPFMTGDVHATSYTFIVSDSNVNIADGTEANTVKVIFGAPQDTKDNISNADTITLTSNNVRTTSTVSVTTTRDVTIQMSNLNIDVSDTADACAFSKTGTGELTVSLAGTNTLTSGYYHAGLEKNGSNTGKLIIKDDENTDGVGSLVAYSGDSGFGYGAGIGGAADRNNGSTGKSGENITIESGSVTAQSSAGAGIGGGNGDSTGGAGKAVTISGGSVTATSTGYGAGIGGGNGESSGGACGDVTISGGSVTANSVQAAGIGSGQRGSQGGSNGAGGTLSSGTNGNAWVVRSGYDGANEAAIDTSGSEFKSGVLFNGNAGTLYGSAVSLTADAMVPANGNLSKGSGTITVPENVTITNNGLTSVNDTISFTSKGKVIVPLSNKKLIFDPNGGTLNVIDVKASSLPNATKTGNTLSNWSDGQNTYNAGDSLGTINADTTLTAQWTPNATAPSTYSVTLKGDGGTGSALTSYTEGTGAALPTDWTKEGYTFAGWYDNEGLTGSAVTSITKTDTGAKTFYAKWTKNGDGATSAPKTPVKVKAKAAGTHSIKITWSKAKGASYYKIYKVTKKSGASAKSNSYKYIGKTAKTSFTAKSLKAGTTYSFKVKAVNSAGNSKLSKIVTAKTKKSSGAVNGSVGFTLSNISGNNVKVHWSKVSGAAKYQVASCRAGAKMKTKWTGTNSLCTYTSTNLTKGKTYKYKMRYCKTSNGKNVWSKWSAVKTIKVK